MTTRDAGPMTFELPEIYGPLAREGLDDRPWEEQAWADAIYGDFPHGPTMQQTLNQGSGLQAVEEADMRQSGWAVLRDQAAIAGLIQGHFSYRQLAHALGLSVAATHKRYAHLLHPEGDG